VLVLYGPKRSGSPGPPGRWPNSWVSITSTWTRWSWSCWRLGLDPIPPTAGWRGWSSGWLPPLATHELVSVEATGAWDSDWRLADDLEARGVRVLRVWVWAPKQGALRRLAGRTARRVPVSVQEASWIYDQATVQAGGRRLDARIDTGSQQDPASVVAVLGPLLGHR
jgi:hypothetical protein